MQSSTNSLPFQKGELERDFYTNLPQSLFRKEGGIYIKPRIAGVFIFQANGYYFIFSINFANIAGFSIAICDSTLRSISMFFDFKIAINLPYVSSNNRTALLSLRIQRERLIPFFFRRSLCAYFPAFKIASLAAT